MDSIVSSVLFFLLGSLALFAGLSARRWRPEEARLRVGAIVVGLVFLIMGILGLMGYIEITGGS
jgi:peptidoglycan/LPS O-acetylase OafA/YrhL